MAVLRLAHGGCGQDRLRYGDAGYRDLLCSFIGLDVKSTTESPETGLVVDFATGSLALNPPLDELVGPEIAKLHVLQSAGRCMVWRPGEGAFAYVA